MAPSKGPFGKDGMKPHRYPQGTKDQAVGIFFASIKDFKTRTECARHIAASLGIGKPETVLRWVRQAEAYSGSRAGSTAEGNDEIRRLKRENAELRRANGIMRAAAAFFAPEPDRPQD